MSAWVACCRCQTACEGCASQDAAAVAVVQHRPGRGSLLLFGVRLCGPPRSSPWGAGACPRAADEAKRRPTTSVLPSPVRPPCQRSGSVALSRHVMSVAWHVFSGVPSAATRTMTLTMLTQASLPLPAAYAPSWQTRHGSRCVPWRPWWRLCAHEGTGSSPTYGARPGVVSAALAVEALLAIASASHVSAFHNGRRAHARRARLFL